MANIDIKTNSKKVSDAKTAAQEKELEALKKQKAEADAKAKQAQKDNEAKRAEQKAAQEKKLAEQKAKEENKEEMMNLAKSAISSVGKSKKSKGFIPGVIIGVIIGIVLSTVLGLGNLLTNEVNEGKETVDEILDESLLGYTALDFENVILGKASEHQELIVMEQPILVETKITKAGLGNLEIFSKVKDVTYSGTGVYTVDLSKIDANHIKVDMDKKTVEVTIPHAVLQYVNPDLQGAKFEDTEKGLLAFGDLALTTEQQNEIEISVKNTMSQTLNNKEFFDQADEFAKLKTWQIFQPLVSAVSNEFIVEMEFE